MRLENREAILRRGRVVRSFDEHWQSWQRIRPALMASPDRAAVDTGSTDGGRDRARPEPVVLTDRADAAAVLRRLCRD